jgi:hypothetical protein
MLFSAVVAATSCAFAQAGADALKEKMAAVKQSVAENQQRLHQYQWTETMQVTFKGDPKPASQSVCRYGPDGQVQKTAITPPPPPPSGGRFKQKMVAKKKEEIGDYMGQVKGLLAMYVPPNPQKMQQAFDSGKASLVPNSGSGAIQIVFRDYAQPGDQMTISYAIANKKVNAVNVKTYLDDPKQVVTLSLQFASLPDGTNYVQRNVLDATAKQIVVTTTNSNYVKLGM